MEKIITAAWIIGLTVALLVWIVATIRMIGG